MKNFPEIERVFQTLVNSYTCLESWHLTLDNAKRRAGACFPTKKRISISRHHLELNELAVVLDTLKHEVAHALAWESHRAVGHGSVWRNWILKLGGTPKATGRFEVPKAKWVMVLKQGESLKVIAERHRRKRNIRQFLLRGQPATKGLLYYVERTQFDAWKAGRLLLNQIELWQ